MPSQPLGSNNTPATITSSIKSSSADPLDQRLIHALEAAPQPQVPADFAARIATALPPRPPASAPITHYGRTAILIGILVVLAAMLALAAPAAGRGTFQLAMEWTLLALFLGLTVWFTARHTHAN